MTEKWMRLAIAAAFLLATPAIVSAAEVYAEGWYGFKNSSPQQREDELQRACADADGRHALIRRVEVPPDKGNTFDKLCESIGMQCATVCGWDGSPHPCDEKPPTKLGDGNRVAKCVQAKKL
jgi:hypothetical protein